MARVSRSTPTPPPSATSPVASRRFQNVTPKFQSSMEGLDPFRGDLTDAFNNFFGGVQKAAGTMAESQYAVEKMKMQTEYQVNMMAAREDKAERNRLKREAKLQDNIENKAAGTNAALDAYMTGGFTNANDAVAAQLSYGQGDNKHFMNAFKENYGSLTGSAMYADFAADAANVPPEEFDSFSQDWWQKNYANGTGDSIVDMFTEAAWSKNYQTARMAAKTETIKNSRTLALSTVSNSIVRKINDNTFTTTDYANAIADVQAVNPAATSGTVRAAVLDMVSSGASKTAKGTKNFLKLLDTQMPTDHPDHTQSLSDRFPTEIDALRQKIYKQHVQTVTMAGSEAVAAVATQISAVAANNPGDLKAQLTAYATIGTAQLNTLENTPGVPLTKLIEARSALAKEVNRIREVQIGMNKMSNFARTGKIDPTLDATSAGEGLSNIIRMGSAKFWENDQAAQMTGDLIKATLETYGPGAITEDTKSMIAHYLTTGDQAAVAKTIQMLQIADPKGVYLTGLLKDYPNAIPSAAMITAGSNAESIVSMAGNDNVKAALLEFSTKGTEVYQQLFPDEKPTDALKEFRSLFSDNSDFAERIEEQIGQDGFFSGYGSPNISPALMQKAIQMAPMYAARIKANPALELDADTLVTMMAKDLGKGVILNADGALDLGNDDNMQTGTGVAVIGHAVPRNDGTGGVEDVYSNMTLAAEEIANGMSGLFIDDDVIGIRTNSSVMINGVRGYEVYQTDTDIPFIIPFNQKFQAQALYDNDGEPLNGIGRFFGNNDLGFSDIKIEFSGGDQDEAIASSVFHPSIRLIPIDGVGYRVAVVPHFRNMDPDYMSRNNLEELAGKSMNRIVPRTASGALGITY